MLTNKHMAVKLSHFFCRIASHVQQIRIAAKEAVSLTPPLDIARGTGSPSGRWCWGFPFQARARDGSNAAGSFEGSNSIKDYGTGAVGASGRGIYGLFLGQW
jgi:hypothetical protein